MNKILSKIAIAIASFAMAIGGISTVSLHNKEQAKPVYAENGDVVAMFDGYNELGYSHTEYVTYHGWKLSWGHTYKCGFDVGEWKTIKEQGYSKYINDTTISPDAYGWVLTKIDPLTFVGGFDFQTSYPPASYLYLTYSLDDITYSLVPLTEGEQGTKLDSNHQSLSYDFDSIREAYYAIVVVSETTNPASNQVFEFDYVLCHFYEKIDPSAERITVSGPNAVYADEDIELTATAYNYNHSEYTWVSSDTSVLTISGSGDTVTIHGVSKGTASVTVTTTEMSQIVYSDPFVITVKQFGFCDFNTSSIELGIREIRDIQIKYQDNNGDVVLEAVSANTNAATLEIYGDHDVYVTAGNVGGISTTVTITIKDNDGNGDCHIATRTVQVTVSARRVFGERLTSRPSNDYEYIYIATIDGNHFVAVDPDTNWLKVTDDIKEATTFTFYSNGYIGFPDPYGYSYYISYQSNRMVLGLYSQPFDVGMSNDRYPGMLAYVSQGFQCFMYYTSTTSIRTTRLTNFESYDNNGNISPSNVFCAYYAIDPGANITPEETSIDLLQSESTDIDAEVAFVSNVTYEIISGSEYIEEVTVSAVDESNHISIHVEATSTCGTAVIRVKDANDDSVYTDITVVVKSATKARVSNTPTQAKLSYSYVVQDKMSYDISDVAIRFGGMLEKDIWNDLDSNYGIEAFGVMLSNSNLIEQCVNEKIADEGSFETAVETGGKYDTVKDNDIKVFYDYLSSGREPAEQGNYYFWNLYKMVNATEVGFTRQYTAVAFILTSDGDVVFFDEVTTSAARLARELNTANPSLDTTLEGSLSYIANFDQEN